MIKTTNYIIMFFLLLKFNSFSQVIEKEIEKNKFSINYYKGYILPHYEFIYANTLSGIQSLDLTYSRRLCKDTVYDKIYNYPEIGVSLFYSTLGNDKVFGRELALVPSFKMYLFESEKIRFFTRIGLGLSYINKKFNFEDNTRYLAVGSNFNIHFDYKVGINYNIKNKILFSFGFGIGHFSNANTFNPNIGINYLSCFTGAEYVFGKNKIKATSLIHKDKSKRITIFTSLGIKKQLEYVTPVSLTLQYEKNISNKYSFGGGVDVTYDASAKITSLSKGEAYETKDQFYTGLSLIQSIHYRKVKFSLQEGIYIIYRNKDNVIYSRAMFSYELTKKVSLRLAIKTHLFIADYPEIGIGLKL